MWRYVYMKYLEFRIRSVSFLIITRLRYLQCVKETYVTKVSNFLFKFLGRGR